MTVTREEAIYAYRLILGREPESETVIGHAMAAADLASLRRTFLDSAEFAHGLPLPIGQYTGAATADLNIDCTPEQLQAIFERIGRAWQAFGETEPHWSVVISDKFRQANLPTNVEDFYRGGVRAVGPHLNMLRRAGLPTRFNRALDFGCGVGRLTLALAPFATEVVGVDISPPHLRLAVERAEATGVTNARFEAIGSVDDMNRYRGFDCVISLIVLQHNPPPVMAALYGKLLAALAPGGVAIVQMPTFIEGQAFSAAEYLASEQPQMEMNALAQPIIYRLTDEADCRLIEVREDGAGGRMGGLSHTFCVQRRS
jgi:2-polyprenyl-3-methyl-5-hydroxy-6-metoxy-1,4-benzoquinol methylase